MTGTYVIEACAEETEVVDFLFDLVVVVEAAGSISRALDLGLIGAGEPEADEVFYQVVPPSRGGKGAEADAEKSWQELVRSLKTVGGTTALRKCRQKIRRLEATRPRT